MTNHYKIPEIPESLKKAIKQYNHINQNVYPVIDRVKNNPVLEHTDTLRKQINSIKNSMDYLNTPEFEQIKQTRKRLEKALEPYNEMRRIVEEPPMSIPKSSNEYEEKVIEELKNFNENHNKELDLQSKIQESNLSEQDQEKVISILKEGSKDKENQNTEKMTKLAAGLTIYNGLPEAIQNTIHWYQMFQQIIT